MRDEQRNGAGMNHGIGVDAHEISSVTSFSPDSARLALPEFGLLSTVTRPAAISGGTRPRTPRQGSRR